MAVISLTQKFIDTALQVPAGKSKIEFVDDTRSGLYILVSGQSQGGTYFLRWKDSTNTTRHIKIGRTTEVTLNDARKMAKTLRAEIALGANPREDQKAKRAIPTLRDFFIETYLPLAKVHKRSWIRDVQLFARIEKAFGHLRLDMITKKMVMVWHASLLDEGLAAATADHHPKLMRRLFSIACEYDLLEKNPLSKFALFNHDNKIEHYLSPEQLVQLMEVLKTDDNRTVCNIAILLLGTGCRLNEILTAKKSDIDVENRVLKIAAINAKGKRVRSVPLNDASLDIIQKQFEDTKGYDKQGEDYLFINHKTGKPYTTIMKVWSRLRNKAGLNSLRIHDLRHSFASFLVNSGRTLFEVQQILGHSNPTISVRYSHLSSKTLQAAANSASLIIQGAMQLPAGKQEQLPEEQKKQELLPVLVPAGNKLGETYTLVAEVEVVQAVV